VRGGPKAYGGLTKKYGPDFAVYIAKTLVIAMLCDVSALGDSWVPCGSTNIRFVRVNME